MAKGKNFGGFGGMNMQAMMKQAQKMQENMLKAQEEIAQRLGLHRITVNRRYKRAVKIMRILYRTQEFDT